ncbi:MAG: hypothetical protein JXQ96_00635 [Cyclobacteriaceae bacterium]
MRKFWIPVGLCLLLLSCNKEKKVQETLFNEVMDVHDEVMPQMSSLRKLAKSLESKLDSIAVDSLLTEKGQKEELNKAIEDLKKANESMMEWMRQFEQIEEGTPHGEVMKYLKDQKKKIEKVRDDMLKAKKQGEYYLN